MVDNSNNIRAYQPREMVESIHAFSSAEIDIIDMILSKIVNENEGEADNLVYTIKLSDYISMIDITASKGSKEMQYKKFANAVHRLYEKSLVFYSIQKKCEFRILQKAEYIYGQAKIVVKLTDDFKMLLNEVKFAHKSRIYYALKNTLPMKSQYSKRIYYMCCQWIGKQMITSPDKLKMQLKASDSYDYGGFKRRVLNKAVEEINSISDLSISYEEKRERVGDAKKPKVVKLIFTVKRKENAPDQSAELWDDDCIARVDDDRYPVSEGREERPVKISHSDNEDGDVFPFGNWEDSGSDEEEFRKFEDEVTGKAFEKQLTNPDDIFL